MSTLDQLLSELASTQDALIATPDDDFGRRQHLRSEQHRLRALIREQRKSGPEPGDAESIRSEISRLEARVEEIRAQRIDVVSQTGGGSESAGWEGLGAMQLNSGIERASGLAELQKRIAELELLLGEHDS